MTVLDFLTGTLGLSPDRADQHLRSSFVRVYCGDNCVDGQVVNDPAFELEPSAKVVLQPPAVTAEGAPNA